VCVCVCVCVDILSRTWIAGYWRSIQERRLVATWSARDRKRIGLHASVKRQRVESLLRIGRALYGIGHHLRIENGSDGSRVRQLEVCRKVIATGRDRNEQAVLEVSLAELGGQIGARDRQSVGS
jgi:hypothetical protein